MTILYIGLGLLIGLFLGLLLVFKLISFVRTGKISIEKEDGNKRATIVIKLK